MSGVKTMRHAPDLPLTITEYSGMLTVIGSTISRSLPSGLGKRSAGENLPRRGMIMTGTATRTFRLPGGDNRLHRRPAALSGRESPPCAKGNANSSLAYPATSRGEGADSETPAAPRRVHTTDGEPRSSLLALLLSPPLLPQAFSAREDSASLVLQKSAGQRKTRLYVVKKGDFLSDIFRRQDGG